LKIKIGQDVRVGWDGNYLGYKYRYPVNPARGRNGYAANPAKIAFNKVYLNSEEILRGFIDGFEKLGDSEKYRIIFNKKLIRKKYRKSLDT